MFDFKGLAGNLGKRFFGRGVDCPFLRSKIRIKLIIAAIDLSAIESKNFMRKISKKGSIDFPEHS